MSASASTGGHGGKRLRRATGNVPDQMIARETADGREDFAPRASTAPSWAMVLGGRASPPALTWLVRTATGHATFRHYLNADAILTVSLLAVPLSFLVGLGGFDYWFYWAAGRPTRPEDHSGHGAHTLEGLLPGQHRPQGDRHPVHGHLLLLPARRRADRDADARPARPAGGAVRRRQHLQRPVLGPRLDADLPLRDPRVRGPRATSCSR